MSEKTEFLLYALWFAHPILQAAIAVAMYRSGQHRVFKYFFAYIVVQIPINVLLIPIYLYSSGPPTFTFTLSGSPLCLA